MQDYLLLLNIYQTCLKMQRKYAKTQKAVANWILSDISRILNEEELEPEHIPFHRS